MRLKRKIIVGILLLATLVIADEIDDEIIKDLEFFSVLEVVEAHELMEEIPEDLPEVEDIEREE